MRRNSIFLILILFSVFFSSCDDYLEVTPENAVTFRKYFSSEQDLEIYVNGMRGDFKNIVQSGPYKHMRGFKYDEVNSQYKKHTELHAESFTPNTVEFFWHMQYRMVSSANILLKNYTKPGLSADRENYYKGIGHFYRGYMYGLIGQMWGEAPLVRYEGDIEPKAKESWDAVIDFAIEDAVEAAKLLPELDALKDYKGKKLTTRDTPSKEAAYALLAHLYAWKASLMNNDAELLAKAVEAATNVINSTNVQLAGSVEEVCTSVLVGGSNESIFESRLIVEETPGANNFYTIDRYMSYPLNPSDGEGSIKWKNFRIKNTTVEEMFSNNDERKNAWFYKFDEMKSKDESITGGFAYPYKIRQLKIHDKWKYVQYINQNAVVYRLSDIILLRAECNAKLSKSAAAISDLNQIRERAKADVYSATEGDLQYVVFKEREKELLWERHRYFDVVRNGYWKTELNGEFKNLTDQDVKDGALYLPVGQRAYENNPLITQNVYWLKRY